MKSLIRAFFLLSSVVICTACQMTAYHTSDQRFPQVFGKEVYTKDRLQIYPPSYLMCDEEGYCCITENTMIAFDKSKNAFGVLPIGHPVIFDRIKRKDGSDYAFEALLGKTVFRGTTYKVSYSLGLVGVEGNMVGDMEGNRFYRHFNV